jgi:hypothetical protein
METTGPWFEVNLSGDRNNPLRVGEFMVDYYDTIRMGGRHGYYWVYYGIFIRGDIYENKCRYISS